jgi:hypothetical protein
MHRKIRALPHRLQNVLSLGGSPNEIKQCVVTGAIAALSMAALAPHYGYARELQGRLGLGYNSQFANSSASERVPGVSVKYGLSRDLAVELVFGMSTATPTNSVLGGKVFKNIFYETQLNFYGFGGGALLAAQNQSGIQMMGGLGAEFFFPGLESLGFSMETGASLDTVSGSMALRTLGVSFIDAGIHFYF